MTDGAPSQEQALQLLGRTIRTFRKRRRLTQRVLAARVGLTRTYVSAIEQGQRNVTNLDVVVDRSGPAGPALNTPAALGRPSRALHPFPRGTAISLL